MKGLSDRINLNNGYSIPCVGYGTWLSPDGEQTTMGVYNAILSGYRHIDCAGIYNNEGSVGEGIKMALAETGLKREDLFITSKCWNSFRKYDEVIKTFNDSIEELGLNYIDLYLIHWPSPCNLVPNWEEVNLEQWKAFEYLYRQGKVKAIGVSNFLPHHIESLMKGCEIKPCINQIEYHIGMDSDDIVSCCKKYDIVVEGYKPLGRGDCVKNDNIIRMAEKYMRSPAQICLRYCIQNGVIPLPKALSLNHMNDNADVFDFTISKEDMDYLDSLKGTIGVRADIDNIQNEKSFFVIRRKDK